MEFFMISAVATIFCNSMPLFFVEVFTRARRSLRDAEFNRHYRRLWLATIAAWTAFAIWFWLDSQAIAAFHRPFVVAGANVLAFAVVFLGFAARIVWPSRQDGVEPRSSTALAHQTPTQYPLIEHPSRAALLVAYLFVVVSLILVLTILLTSTNSVGHRIKGMGLMIIGVVFFFLFLRMRQLLLTAIAYYCAFEASAVLTLTLDFNIPSRRWLGVGSHLAVGALGLIGCARWLATKEDS
ncbi:MAG: hypothetical protein ACREAB_01220 [Blastocatellia bacterium]